MARIQFNENPWRVSLTKNTGSYIIKASGWKASFNHMNKTSDSKEPGVGREQPWPSKHCILYQRQGLMSKAIQCLCWICKHAGFYKIPVHQLASYLQANSMLSFQAWESVVEKGFPLFNKCPVVAAVRESKYLSSPVNLCRGNWNFQHMCIIYCMHRHRNIQIK